MRMTIYELLSFVEGIDGIDIGDDVFDFVTHIDCHIKKGDCQDNYDKCMRYLCTQLELSNYKPNWYSNCYISEYIKKNIVAFDRFMNEENEEKFQPQNYDDIDDETFYDLYLNTFENLVVGNYADEDYEKLLRYLKEGDNYGKSESK